jgi:hypothetical protein
VLQIVRNNNPLTVLILLIYALAINWQVLFHPQMPVVPEGDFLFHIITGFLGVVLFQSAFGFTLLSVIMLAIQGIYLNAVANKHKLFYKPTYVTAFVYISLTALSPTFGYFSQPVLINWVLIMLTDAILQLAQSQKPRKIIFNTGFALGIAGLLMFPAMVYILALLAAISILRNLNPGEWMVALLGWITPVYFAAGLLYLFDVLHWLPGWVDVGFSLPGSIKNPVFFIGALMGLVTLFAMGTYALQKQLVRVSIFVRRGWTAIAICLFLSFVVGVFTDHTVSMAWLIVMPAFTLVVANAYFAEKNRAFSNFAFYFMLLLVVFCKLSGS